MSAVSHVISTEMNPPEHSDVQFQDADVSWALLPNTITRKRYNSRNVLVCNAGVVLCVTLLSENDALKKQRVCNDCVMNSAPPTSPERWWHVSLLASMFISTHRYRALEDFPRIASPTKCSSCTRGPNPTWIQKYQPTLSLHELSRKARTDFGLLPCDMSQKPPSETVQRKFVLM